jgi:hypothetical protein
MAKGKKTPELPYPEKVSIGTTRARHNRVGKIQTEVVDIRSLKLDPNNANTHDHLNLRTIARSLEQFGQVTPIVVNNDNVIIKGNGTYTAAVSILKWSTIEVTRVNFDSEEAMAYALIDNRSSDLSKFDKDVVAQQVAFLSDKGWATADVGWEETNWDSDLGEEEADKEEDPDKPDKPIKVTSGQRQVIDEAIAKMKAYTEQDGGPPISEGRALELICAEFLSSFNPDTYGMGPPEEEHLN